MTVVVIPVAVSTAGSFTVVGRSDDPEDTVATEPPLPLAWR